MSEINSPVVNYRQKLLTLTRDDVSCCPAVGSLVPRREPGDEAKQSVDILLHRDYTESFS